MIFQPLIIDAGEQEQVGTRRTEILRLNVGPAIPIVVVATVFTVTRTCHRISNRTATDFEITRIDGGLEGDILILFTGKLNGRVILNSLSLPSPFPQLGNLDLSADFEFMNRRHIVLYKNATNWVDLGRQ